MMCVLFVLFSRVVLFTLERKYSSVVCVCVSCGLPSASFGHLAYSSPLKTDKPAVIRAGRVQLPWSEGAAGIFSAKHYGMMVFPKEARRKSKLKNSHAEALRSLWTAGEFQD